MELRNGFLLVASVMEEYIHGANYCAASIKDYYPDAHITLFVSKELKHLVEEENFDLVICDEKVPDHTRTKLYALAKTPYTNLTVYVDADMECMHEDIKNIWNEMPDDCDILITKIRPYNGKEDRWPGGKTIPKGQMVYHGGFFMYRNNEKTINFMQRWWDDYHKQRSDPWPYDINECRKSFGQWDQFTFWKLLEIDKLPVNVQVFKDDARWNFVNGYRLNENKDPIIFYHHTLPKRRQKELEIAAKEKNNAKS